ncbi:ABC transporter permease [Blastococcus saxobsidens]|uniref:ABC transporter permease protein n=1 Tax=Blastococcus saxobsidens (strain DD2) TaxID=1146883 RepID=H6RNS4_BLASD|nr:ABC transporter permease [Blastococcus saxobsidens]CCG05222.1 ABC transporter; permease protein [Blastococcus saxobsidens DD2]
MSLTDTAAVPGATAAADRQTGRRFRDLPPAARRGLLAVLLLVLWQAAVMITGVRSLLVPSPLDVARALVEDIASLEIINATYFTMRTLLTGTAVGMVVGLLLATFAVLSRTGHDLLKLLVSILNPLPSIAILPLAMIWFGLTPTAIIVVILNSTVWPIALNADMGFRTVSPTLQRAARTLGIRGLRMVRQVLLPAALPHLLSGVRMAWAFGWRTVVAAELVFGVAGGAGGLGFYINQSRYFLETASVFAGLVVISALGLLIESVFALIERRTVERWGMAKPS